MYSEKNPKNNESVKKIIVFLLPKVIEECSNTKVKAKYIIPIGKINSVCDSKLLMDDRITLMINKEKNIFNHKFKSTYLLKFVVLKKFCEDINKIPNPMIKKPIGIILLALS